MLKICVYKTEMNSYNLPPLYGKSYFNYEHLASTINESTDMNILTFNQVYLLLSVI